MVLKVQLERKSDLRNLLFQPCCPFLFLKGEKNLKYSILHTMIGWLVRPDILQNMGCGETRPNRRATVIQTIALCVCSRGYFLHITSIANIMFALEIDFLPKLIANSLYPQKVTKSFQINLPSNTRSMLSKRKSLMLFDCFRSSVTTKASFGNTAISS